MSETKFSALERSAILMMVLGEDATADIMRFIGPREVQKIGAVMNRLPPITQAQAEVILDEFLQSLEEATSLGVDSEEFIRNTLTKSLGSERANAVIERILNGGNTVGLDNLKWMDGRGIAEMIKSEHPQVVGMILAYMEPEQAAEVLPHLNERLRFEAMLRVASLESVQPSALQELNDVFEQQLNLDATKLNRAQLGGIKPAAAILNVLDGSAAQALLGRIRDADATLAQHIEDQMFVFDDLINAPDTSVQVLLREVQTENLLVALKGAAPELLDKFTRNMTKRAADILREDLDARGPVRVSDVESAQREILAVAKRLEEAGKITLGTGAGDTFI